MPAKPGAGAVTLKEFVANRKPTSRLMLHPSGELSCLGTCEHGSCRKLVRFRPGGASLTCACVFKARPVPRPVG